MGPPPGNTLWEQARYIHQDGTLRNFVLNEPRGGVFRHVNLLVPPKNPAAQMGWIIMEPSHTPPMSGSNSICVSTVLLETGIIPMEEPETKMILEAPGGLVHVRASCSNGKVERIFVENVPSFADLLDTTLEVEGVGSLKVDTAFGGDSFVTVGASDLGFAIRPDEAKDLVTIGIQITKAANEQLIFRHPTNADWNMRRVCSKLGKIFKLSRSSTLHLAERFWVKQLWVINRRSDQNYPGGRGSPVRLSIISIPLILGHKDIALLTLGPVRKKLIR